MLHFRTALASQLKVLLILYSSILIPIDYIFDIASCVMPFLHFIIKEPNENNHHLSGHHILQPPILKLTEISIPAFDQ